MSTEITLDAPNVREATERFKARWRGYQHARQGVNLADITRARAEFGMACLEWIEVLVARAERDDERDPQRAAILDSGTTIPVSTSRDRALLEASIAYRDSRLTGIGEAIVASRGAYRLALVTWLEDLDRQLAGEDEQHVADLLSRLDESDRFDPQDAFSEPPISHAEALVRESRERDRERHLMPGGGYDYGSLSGWRSAEQ
jgi:hypothetical protein